MRPFSSKITFFGNWPFFQFFFEEMDIFEKTRKKLAFLERKKSSLMNQ